MEPHSHPLSIQHGHRFPSVYVHDHGNLFQGDVHHHHYPQQVTDRVDAFGLCFGSAPLIEPQDFIGRRAEIDAVIQILQPGSIPTEQRRVVLGGMGGIGKTQLAIAYARQCQYEYASIFWLNATSELTLQAGYRSIAARFINAQELEILNPEQIVARAHKWLSDVCNPRWLLIFDNYDEPDQFDVVRYYPNTAHGSIIITSRPPDLVNAQQVHIQPLSDVQEALEILQQRSQREDVEDDAGARRLAQRLDGLPLALATAGAYLRRSTITFEQYLVAYEQRWNINPRRSLQLREYQDRTLYTTWNLSYNRLEADDPSAAKLLRLLAYFDNQEIWFELLYAGLHPDLPEWLRELSADHLDFNNAMAALVDYCFMEVHSMTQSYSMHSCVHDWTLGELSSTVHPPLYWHAFDCVAASIDTDDWEILGQIKYARITRQAMRLVHPWFQGRDLLAAISSDRTNAAIDIATLLLEQGKLTAAEQMYVRALAGYEKALGLDHTSTLDTVNNLGVLYSDQGKLAEAEQMYVRALAGKEKALGLDHKSTLKTVNNLGILYQSQGKLAEAEQMYVRALAGKEKALGLDHISTLDTVSNLGILYRHQGKLAEAEQMRLRALAGYEKALG